MQVNCQEKPIIAITSGHPHGIGAEVFLKALRHIAPQKASFLYLGPRQLLEKSGLFESGLPPKLHSSIEICAPEKSTMDAVALQQWSLLKSTELAKKSQIGAICTLPITKDSLVDVDGMGFAGQTEFYEHYLGNGQESLMCFGGAGFLLNLMTTHIPVAEIADHLAANRIRHRIIRLIRETRKHSGVRDVRISILGLNPHAGEGGLLGHEEQEYITPAIGSVQRDEEWKNVKIEGPLAADGFFGRLPVIPKDQWPHGVLAMYHDQGLAPYKLLGRGKIANITLGLSVARTSPAHGTAFDIAQKNIADPTSMIEALETAIKLASYSGGSPHARGCPDAE